ncbi:MAG: flagellin [Myxococcota bacterium]|nr:flagellin [Myxococcota bacterium]
MSIRLRTNVESLAPRKQLARNQRDLRQSTRKLSSGLRISRAADAAAQLGNSEKMQAQIRSYRAAHRNANDAISMIQVAESAWQESSSILSRMRELAVQSASDVLQSSDRANLSLEFSTLQEELDRIAGTTEFNGLDLGLGTAGIVGVQVGVFEAGTTNRINIRFGNMTAISLGVASNTTRVTTTGTARAAIGNIDQAIERANFFRSDIASNQNRIASAMRNTENTLENLVEANSRIQDVDIAEESANHTRGRVFQQAGVALLSQANVSSRNALALLS